MEKSLLITVTVFITAATVTAENITFNNAIVTTEDITLYGKYVTIDNATRNIENVTTDTGNFTIDNTTKSSENITTEDTDTTSIHEMVAPKCLKTHTSEKLYTADQENNIAIINGNDWNKNFYECLKLRLAINELCAIDESTIFVPAYGITYNSSNYYATNNTVHVCIHFPVDTMDEPHESKSTDTLGTVGAYLTKIGISVSNICLGLHFIAFLLIPEIRNLPGKNLAALTVAVFFSNLFFLVAQEATGNKGACVTLASFALFFFLSSFLWMSVIGFETWRSLRMASTELRLCTKLMEQKRYIHYSLYAWLTPLVLVAIVLILDNANGVNKSFRPELGKGKHSCWFSQIRPTVIFFVLPLVTVMASNVIFFLWSAFVIHKHTDRLNQDKKFKSLIRKFSSYGKLAIVTGLTWITGIVAFAARHTVTWYIFIIFTTFYGSFIFISFTCTKKVLRLLQKRFPFAKKWLPTQSSYSTSSEQDTHESRT